MLQKNNQLKHSPLVLAILDGWGIAPTPRRDDPTQAARLPFFKSLLKNYPCAILKASGAEVGLPKGQDGNSEAGHLNLGAGRIVEQDAVYISRSIKDGTFFKNSAFTQAINHVKKNKSSLHLMGLLSNYNSGHSAPDHLQALLKLAAQNKVKQVYLHLFTDGRDSPKYDAVKLIGEVKKRLKNGEKIATLVGRLYGMDRKKDWVRTKLTYKLLTQGEGIVETEAESALRHAYNRGESDEFISPIVITDEHHKPLGLIKDNDAVIFFNLRSDRARQLAKPFVQDKFEQLNTDAFTRQPKLKNLCFVALTDFGPDLGNINTAFPSRDVADTFTATLKNSRQLYIAESEKFAHVTYFFNGGYAEPIAGEKRIMVQSDRVASYDQVPAMQSKKITNLAIKSLNKFDIIVINLASADMVGHTGNFKACVLALETIDWCLSKLAGAVKKKNGTLAIVADHGNVEETVNLATGEIDTEHSTNPVPFILFNNSLHGKKFVKKSGVLGDVAPTLLDWLGVNKPKLMTRKSLL
ncbi:MAG: 2,3-bisphosphoglycerate-independent phosphoglycerate mutase [Patescibacteria group bacterium]